MCGYCQETSGCGYVLKVTFSDIEVSIATRLQDSHSECATARLTPVAQSLSAIFAISNNFAIGQIRLGLECYGAMHAGGFVSDQISIVAAVIWCSLTQLTPLSYSLKFDQLEVFFSKAQL